MPAETITGVGPGVMFVHRNIANLVSNTDLNAASVIDYAVQHLKVKQIIVCGHYGCCGVKAAMTPDNMGVLTSWLQTVRDVYDEHKDRLKLIESEEDRHNSLVEYNVLKQCRNVAEIIAVQQSLAVHTFPIVHGWVYRLNDGLLTDLKFNYKN